jgi:hypothetical protein
VRRVCGLAGLVDLHWPEYKVITAKKSISRLLILAGNALTAIGCVGLVLALSGLIQAEFFALGISSGIRVIGSVAVAGCLLSAIGYGVVEYFEK